MKPRVTVVIPFCREPAEVVIETIASVQNLAHDPLSIIVVQNNSRDENWKAIKAHCERDPRIRYVHLGTIGQFKACALNLSLPFVPEDTFAVAHVDADYVVDKNWIADFLPRFADEGVWGVQYSQAYRFSQTDRFDAAMSDEYDLFFQTGMRVRNELNTLILHGTMMVIRYDKLREFRWAEWSNAEDTELGVRLTVAGGKLVFVNRVLGRGLLPGNFSDYRRQRFRWAYGAIGIFKEHLPELVWKKNALSLRQRIHFFCGWLPWASHVFYPFFLFGAVYWGVQVWRNYYFALPTAALLPPILFFSAHAVSIIVLNTGLRRQSLSRTLRLLVASQSLVPTISASVLYSWVTTGYPFTFTNKERGSYPGKREKTLALFHGLFFLLCLALTTGLLIRWEFHPHIALEALVVLLLALPSAAFLLMVRWSSTGSRP